MSRRSGLLLVTAALLLSACTAGDPRFSAEAPAGFWVGLWHGVISCITLVVGIFSDTVRVYEVHNTGGWYDFGFLLGVTSIWGGGSGTMHHRARRRKRDAEWEDLSQKVEAKIRRKIRRWAEAEPDDDWEVVGDKAERKLKSEIRKWAETP